MTESHDLPPLVGPEPEAWHVHHGTRGLWTATAHLHACGHLVANLGRLDVASHRMVWFGHTLVEPQSHEQLQAWLAMRELINQEMQVLNTPPW